MLPYLKKLHFLPVKYRISFKIAMLAFKCLQGSSSQYIQELVARKIPLHKYNLRDNEDGFCLKIRVKCQTVKAECTGTVCFYIYPLKFGMHYHFTLEKLMNYKLSSAN